MTDDRELLRRYVEERDERAFAEFVERHVGTVYSAARRRVGGDTHLAQEVVQSVFIRCARKAAALRLHPALSGWLHRSSRFAAIDALRAKRRRQHFEENGIVNLPDDRSSNPDIAWSEIRPIIDALLDRLGGGERDAVALRFFEGSSFAEIAVKLRVSEDAARRRVDRAIEKLHVALARRGIRSSTAVLELALTQHLAIAAPAGLAASVSAGALTAAVAGGSGITALAFFAMNKLNTAVLGILVAGSVIGVFVESQVNRALRRDIVSLRQKADLVVGATTSAGSAASAITSSTSGYTAEERARWRARIEELKARPDGVVDAEIKPKHEWKEAGHATPEAAIETFIWAAANARFDTLAHSYAFGDKTKIAAEAFFATLSPELQARYVTPERLFAPYVAAGPTKREVDAMQVIDVREGDAADEVVVHYWVRFADGTGREDTLPFRRTADGWRMGSHAMGISIPTAVAFLHDRVDSNIGVTPGTNR